MGQSLYCRVTSLAVAVLCISSLALGGDLNEALDRASRLEGERKYSEVIEVLMPYASVRNQKAEAALANAYLQAAIGSDGKGSDDRFAARMVSWAMDAAKHESGPALNVLSIAYLNGMGVAVDTVKAHEFLKRAVAAGDNGAKLSYALRLYRGAPDIPRDELSACALFKDLMDVKAAEGIATYYMGLVTYRGQCNLPSDPKAGMALIQTAANLGVALAEFDVARNFEYGWTTEIDLQRAIPWYERAAANGDGRALWRIGMMYVKGELRQPDAVRAVSYFERAVEAGSNEGMTSLAVMYATGQGVKQDFSKAKSLYEQAAQMGNAHAYLNLAAMHLLGEGVPVDAVEARVIYARGIAAGADERPEMLKAIEAKMTAEQLRQANERILREIPTR